MTKSLLDWNDPRRVFRVTEISDSGSLTLSADDDSGLMSGEDWKEEWGPLPVIGDKFVIVGVFGSMKEGFERLDGTVLRNKEDYDRANRAMIGGWKQEQIDAYNAHHDEWNADVAALPEPFRKRMERFLSEEGEYEFWSGFSGTYEMFIVQQAQALYEVFLEQTEPAETFFRNFKDAPLANQKEIFPGLDDGHSGNTHGAMIYMAHRVALGLEI